MRELDASRERPQVSFVERHAFTQITPSIERAILESQNPLHPDIRDLPFGLSYDDATTNHNFVLKDVGSGEMVGVFYIGLHITDTHVHWATIGYAIAEEHRQKGYATEAVKTALTLIPETAQYILAQSNQDNTASMRVLMENGFTAYHTQGEHVRTYYIERQSQ